MTKTGYDMSTFIYEKDTCNNFFNTGTVLMHLNGVTKRIKAHVMKDVYEFNGHQPHFQTCFGDNELLAELSDGSIVKAEYAEYIGSPPRFANTWNNRHPSQKKVVRYMFS